MVMVKDTVTVLDGQSTPATYQATVWRDTTTDELATAVRELPGDIDASWWSYVAPAGGIDNTTSEFTLAPAVAGLRNYLTDLIITADTLGAVTDLVIRDGTGGAAPVLIRIRLQAFQLPGLIVPLRTPLKGSVNTPLNILTETAVSGDVYVNAVGFKAA